MGGHVKLANPKSKKTHEKKTKAQSQAITRRKTPIRQYMKQSNDFCRKVSTVIRFEATIGQ